MISDFIKGKEQFVFSGNVRQGIVLHRQIDQFTDTHPATKKAMEIFRPYYRLYSAPIMDILFDHFLANDPTVFNERTLKEFTRQTYSQLEEHTVDLPVRFLHAFTYMKAEDWLYNYKYVEGMRKSLYGLVRRASFIKESDTAYRLFLEHHSYLNECYNEFWPDVKQFAKQKLEELIS